MIVRTTEQATDAITGPVVLFRMDSDRYDQLPETKQNLELLKGEVVISPRPRAEHQVFIAELYSALKPWVEGNKLGGLFPDVDMRLAHDWSPARDLAFVRTENLGRIQKGRIVGPADLAVEVLSPSNITHARVDKFAAYGRFGIDWYWIVDLAGRVLDEYQRVGDVYANGVRAPLDQPFKPRVFPGLTLDLARMAR